MLSSRMRLRPDLGDFFFGIVLSSLKVLCDTSTAVLLNVRFMWGAVGGAQLRRGECVHTCVAKDLAGFRGGLGGHVGREFLCRSPW